MGDESLVPREGGAATRARISRQAAQRVPSTAGGSSFDGTAFARRAHEMRVFERWRACADDAAYRSVLTPPLLELSHCIFGLAVTAALPDAA